MTALLHSIAQSILSLTAAPGLELCGAAVPAVPELTGQRAGSSETCLLILSLARPRPAVILNREESRPSICIIYILIWLPNSYCSGDGYCFLACNIRV